MLVELVQHSRLNERVSKNRQIFLRVSCLRREGVRSRGFLTPTAVKLWPARREYENCSYCSDPLKLCRFVRVLSRALFRGLLPSRPEGERDCIDNGTAQLWQKARQKNHFGTNENATSQGESLFSHVYTKSASSETAVHELHFVDTAWIAPRTGCSDHHTGQNTRSMEIGTTSAKEPLLSERCKVGDGSCLPRVCCGKLLLGETLEVVKLVPQAG